MRNGNFVVEAKPTSVASSLALPIWCELLVLPNLPSESVQNRLNFAPETSMQMF